MASRIDLHNLLVSILGTRNVYFQPPESIKLVYPCIVYERLNMYNVDASNDVYLQNYSYQITTIYVNPDDELPKKVSKNVKCRHTRHYSSNGLNYDVFIHTVQNT